MGNLLIKFGLKKGGEYKHFVRLIMKKASENVTIQTTNSRSLLYLSYNYTISMLEK